MKVQRERLIRCSTCKQDFSILESQYKYQTKAGRVSFYCSLKCAGRREENVKRIGNQSEPYRFTSKSPKYTNLISEEKKLESSMREFTRRFRSRSNHKFNKYGNVEVSIDHLVEVWIMQKGQCYFTKVSLVLPRDLNYSIISPNFKASVDRIDNNIGYVNKNVRFVSHTVNNLRNSMSDNLVYEFLNLVKII